MPLTHDIGVRIPYPLLETDNFGCLFFCLFVFDMQSRRLHRLMLAYWSKASLGWHTTTSSATFPHIPAKTTYVQTQKKGQSFDYPS